MGRKISHICFVEYGYPHIHGGGGGAGTYVKLIAKELVHRGYKVSVITSICKQCPETFDDEGIQVYRYASYGKFHWYLSKIPFIRNIAIPVRYLEYGWSVFRFLENLNKHEPVDLVEFSEGGDFWHAFIHRLPYIAHLHGSAYTFSQQSGRKVGLGRLLERKLELLFIRKASAIFSPCKALVNIVSKEAGTPLPDTFVLPYPLDSRLLFHSRNDSIEKKDDKRVLFAARNDPIKGGDILLHAVPLIREHYQNVQFDFFGYQLAVNEKVPAGVNLHPFVNKSDLIEYYRNADICVIPSLWDNSPNTVYEAMAAGKPVVATKVGGIPELVINEETGLLVEPRDVIGIANALIYLLNKPEECKRMGVNGLERIRKIANLEENVARRLLMYKSIIGT